MSQHRRFTIDTDVPVYFCDPHSPWQRGSNENTACFGSISRRAPTCGFTPPTTSWPPPRSSTAGPGKPLTGTPQHNASICSSIPTNSCSVATTARNRPKELRQIKCNSTGRAAARVDQEAAAAPAAGHPGPTARPGQDRGPTSAVNPPLTHPETCPRPTRAPGRALRGMTTHRQARRRSRAVSTAPYRYQAHRNRRCRPGLNPPVSSSDRAM